MILAFVELSSSQTLTPGAKDSSSHLRNITGKSPVIYFSLLLEAAVHLSSFRRGAVLVWTGKELQK